MPADTFYHRMVQPACLLFITPFVNELKDSWEFAAVPLHFLQQGWPMWLWGMTIAIATLLRVPMNALLTWQGDWLIVILLAMATACAVCMLVWPDSPAAVVVGVAAGHCVDTTQVQASLCYRWSADGSSERRKSALRLMAFSATLGYSTGALMGGGLYESAGYTGCAVLQLCNCGSLTVVTASLPVVHASFLEWWHGDFAVTAVAAASEHAKSKAPTFSAPSPAAPQLTLRGTTGPLLLPVSLVLLCDGLNVGAYVTEWALFAVYFKQVHDWSSTLTGAAQMAGDLLAAGILALTTTTAWSRLLGAGTYSGAPYHLWNARA